MQSGGGPSCSLFKGVLECDAEPNVPSHSNVGVASAMELHEVLQSIRDDQEKTKNLDEGIVSKVLAPCPRDAFVSALEAPCEVTVSCLGEDDAEKLFATCPTVRWLSGLVD